ncbi:hypothetical protein J5N97_008071 [Dioscorea zingiberensis]|uniref:CBM20 domain-containing protein n=1 Tax=Dioscorea zingiberensis TaxID=325984 RepID=A0A9D5HU89_9LILI|nr:hypothetical protein J5N97_008071 [Dioscorea zingiberensis]
MSSSSSSSLSFAECPRLSSMEIASARLPPLLGSLPSSRACGSRFAKRALSPYILHWTQSQNNSNIGLCIRPLPFLLRSAVMPLRNGDSAVTCDGLCNVLWSIEADVGEGYLIFLTGDPVSLGSWEPDMAVLLSPSKEHANLWRTEIKVPCGIHFKYSYFMKKENQSSCNLVWRQGPSVSLSIPNVSVENQVIVVRDSWLRNRIDRLPAPSWGSWMVNLDLIEHQIKHRVSQASFPGELKILRNPNGVPSGSKQLSNIAMDNCKPMEKNARINPSASEKKLSEREQPVEEPWLLQATLLSVKTSIELQESLDADQAGKIEYPRKLQQDIETLEPKDECKTESIVESASTVILINSSVCTMQRIAVLEDRQLVELLLEPVKNNVQCDNVYLGVVTQFVPHMGGAFVDIGISRPSLMDIKPNREPFVYPPFDGKVNGEVLNSSLNVNPKDQVEASEHDHPYNEDDMIDDEFLEDDPLHSMREDFDEAEDGIPEDLEINSNNGAIHSSDRESDFEEYDLENSHPIEDESTEDLLPSEMDHSIDSDLSNLIQQGLKTITDTKVEENKWARVQKGTKVIVQVVKEGLGTKGPALSAYPSLRSRFWILITRCGRIGVSKKITGAERTRLRVIAKKLQPPGFGLTVRTVAAGHSLKELQKDLDGLLSTWKGIVEHAKSAALAAEEGVEGAVPTLLHRAMGQTLFVVQDYFNEKVKSMVVDSPRTYHEVTRYLQEIAPDLCDRVILYDKRTPIFYEYGIEEEINNILSKRVPLANGGSLVIEQTEALVSIDVNGGHGMLGQETSQEKAVLDVNLAAAKQIARELRLRDIGGIIVVDFIDMADESNRRLVYEEVKKAVERDRSMVRVSELSKHGLMEITRKRVRPSVTFMISEPCTCCHATGRVEALETSFSKIEHEICRLLAASYRKPDPGNAKSWPQFVLRVDRHMCNYLTSGKRTKLAVLSSSLKVWILLKVARGFSRGMFEVKPFVNEQENDGHQVAISRLQPTAAKSFIPNTKLTLFPVKKWKTRGK